MDKKNNISEAEAYRNSLLLTFYGLETFILNATTKKDYVDLIRQTGTLAKFMADVLSKIAESGKPLAPVTQKNIDWIKKQL